jgi:hypothetical protein
MPKPASFYVLLRIITAEGKLIVYPAFTSSLMTTI